MTKARLTVTSKNYSSWSLRGWLLARFSGLDFEERLVPADDPAMRAELLLLSSSILVPCLDHDGISVWDTLAIGEYLNDVRPKARFSRLTLRSARDAARSAARCIRVSPRCVRHCR